MALDRELIKQRLRDKAAQRMNNRSTSNIDSNIGSMTDEVLDDLFNNAEDTSSSMPDDVDIDIATSFEEEIPPVRESYTHDKNSSVPVFSNMRPEQKKNVYSITPKACVIPRASNFFERHRRKMIETHTGMSYMYRESFVYLLDSGINHLIGQQSISSAKDIKKVAIENNIVKLHNFELDPSNMLDPVIGNTLYDLIDFKILFKKFPMLQHLRLDTEASEILTLKYGDKPDDIFQEVFIVGCPSLQVLELTVGSKVKRITRKGFNANDVDSALRESRMRSELDQVSSALNPKKDRMTKAERHRVSERDKSMKKNDWGTAKEFGVTFAKNLGKVSLYGLTGLTILTGHFIMAGMLGTAIKSIKDMKKGK